MSCVTVVDPIRAGTAYRLKPVVAIYTACCYEYINPLAPEFSFKF